MKLPNALRPAAIGKFAVTAAVVAAAVYAGWQLWVHYEVEPWTCLLYTSRTAGSYKQSLCPAGGRWVAAAGYMS